MVLLVPKVTLLVHPVNTDIQRTVPPGFRWAVMVGEGDDNDLTRCAEARWCPTEKEAVDEGEMVTVAVCNALRKFGIPVPSSMRVNLGHDPLLVEG